MSDIESAIKFGELVVTTAEALIEQIDKVKASIADSIADLKQEIAVAKKKARDDLSADRRQADDALDKKFDHKVGDESSGDNK